MITDELENRKLIKTNHHPDHCVSRGCRRRNVTARHCVICVITSERVDTVEVFRQCTSEGMGGPGHYRSLVLPKEIKCFMIFPEVHGCHTTE